MSKTVERPGKASEVEQVIDLSLRLCQQHLERYGATRSRHDFTPRQLMTCLILKAYLKTTYRGVLDLLAASPNLSKRIGLEKLPHFTTLQKFSGRSQVVAIAQKIIATVGKSAAKASKKSPAAMDATGMAMTTASDYFQTRRGGKTRQWVKVSVMVLCGSLLPLGLAVGFGPSNDRVHGKELIEQAQQIKVPPPLLYADAGYDSEPMHQQCRGEWGVKSVIKPIQRRADGKRGGRWRSVMRPEYLKKQKYGKRWAVETFFSALKRTTGGALQSRRPQQMIAEATFRVLAYVLRR